MTRNEARSAVDKVIKEAKADEQLNRLVGQALTQKEHLITELEKELNLEKARRNQMNA